MKRIVKWDMMTILVFIFGDVAGAEKPEFDDSSWASVSLPHTWNDTDTYRAYIRHSGSDVARIDFEFVDAQGRRCPTDEGRIDFAVTGTVVWRGGLNAAKLNSRYNLYLDTECGINLVAILSTTTQGTITVTATREGITPAAINIESKPVSILNGLTTNMPQTLLDL